MKRAFVLLATFAMLSITEGCAQHPVTPPTYTCPASGAGVYTDLNPSGQSGETYTASPSGQSCYEVQGLLSGAYGAASNVVGPSAGGATGTVNLSWTCTAAAGQTCTGVSWIVQVAAAVPSTAPATPTMGAPTTSQVVKPALRNEQFAANVPVAKLSAVVR